MGTITIGGIAMMYQTAGDEADLLEGSLNVAVEQDDRAENRAPVATMFAGVLGAGVLGVGAVALRRRQTSKEVSP